eukprot:1158264-Pelagomonas_calceolata.AAC.2
MAPWTAALTSCQQQAIAGWRWFITQQDFYIPPPPFPPPRYQVTFTCNETCFWLFLSGLVSLRRDTSTFAFGVAAASGCNNRPSVATT